MPEYQLGKGVTIAIGATTYTNAQMVKAPAIESNSVRVPHLGGTKVLSGGVDSYGEVVFSIPEDGTASKVNPTTKAIVITYPAPLSKVRTGSGHVIKDEPGVAEKSKELIRTITVKMSGLMTTS